MTDRPPDHSGVRLTDGPWIGEESGESTAMVAAATDAGALEHDLDETFDYVVVGSGAAGATAADRLSNAGYKVAIVEEGPWVPTASFGRGVDDAFATLMRDAATQAMEGRSFIPLLQGRCVGGSTVVNSAIAWRVPEDVLEDWARRFGLLLSARALEPHYEALERDLSVGTPARATFGRNNELFLEAARALGVPATAMRRYDRGCTGSGRCLTGCPTGAKQGMHVTFIPRAIRLGARLFFNARVARIEFKNGRAAGVVARRAPRDGGGSWFQFPPTLRLRARRGVVVAASTVQTPNLLARSGVRHGALGHHFQAHPGIALVGRFDREVRMDVGATQGAESVHFRDRRFKLETIAMPPELLVARIPGAGPAVLERALDYRHLGVWAAQVRMRAEGRVTRRLGGDRVFYTPTVDDMRATREAAVVLARLFFAAGAREVWPGIHGVPPILRSPDQIALVEAAPLDPRAYSFIASHLFGAARMSAHPSDSVVAPDFAVRGTRGLYVVDSSVFPTNLGVNPQHTIMAVARLAADSIAERGAKAA